MKRSLFWKSCQNVKPCACRGLHRHAPGVRTWTWRQLAAPCGCAPLTPSAGASAPTRLVLWNGLNQCFLLQSPFRDLKSRQSMKPSHSQLTHRRGGLQRRQATAGPSPSPDRASRPAGTLCRWRQQQSRTLWLAPRRQPAQAASAGAGPPHLLSTAWRQTGAPSATLAAKNLKCTNLGIIRYPLKNLRLLLLLTSLA